MQHEKLQKIIIKDELSPHQDFIKAIIKPCVDIVVTDESPKNTESRFSGRPLVPIDFIWPKHEIGVYRFLAQINFEEIANRPVIFPERGILSLFYAFDEDGEIFWGDDDYVIAFYWPDLEGLVVIDNPNFQPTESLKIELVGGIDIPRHKDLRNDWPFETDIFYELTEEEYYSENYMLGYPSFCSLAYDPTPSPEWISLLTLASYDEFDWCWHDGDKLMVFIESDKLLVKDFSHLKSDAG